VDDELADRTVHGAASATAAGPSGVDDQRIGLPRPCPLLYQRLEDITNWPVVTMNRADR
jgi:predicted RNA polymerase sigma factor